jgi:exopolyphosphatase/guanosine-5'-triphosphate,3'-diphosphate pyrophosphatase
MQAIIDMGSNTIRLSIYQMNKGLPELVLSKKKTVGLSSYINDEHLMSDEGIQAAIKTLIEFRKVLKNLNIRKKYVIATAAIRNAANVNDIIEIIRKKTRMNIDLISGEDEALYDLKGVLLMNQFDSGMILDIGGGSTEIVIYENKQVKEAFSIPIGSLNAYMMYVKEIIPTKEEAKQIENQVEKLIEPYVNHNVDQLTMYGVGGTMRGVLKLAKAYHLDVPENEVSYDQLKDIMKSLKAKKKALLKVFQTIPERTHTITPGMIIAKTILKAFQAKLVIVNYYGLREGYMAQKYLDAKLKRQLKS